MYVRPSPAGKDITVDARQIHLPRGHAAVVVSADPEMLDLTLSALFRFDPAA